MMSSENRIESEGAPEQKRPKAPPREIDPELRDTLTESYRPNRQQDRKNPTCRLPPAPPRMKFGLGVVCKLLYRSFGADQRGRR